LYIDYIGELLDKLNELKKIVAKPEAFSEGWARVEKVLKRAKEEESRRSSSLLALESSSTAVSQEAAILEYSHMKKFFQSTTFVEVVRRESAKKLTEPTAAIGAAVAAVLVTSLERASASWTTMGSSGGIAVVALGIALYALRDRLKDRFRDYTLRRLKKIIADVDVVLKSQKLVIGRAKEWYMQLKSHELPQEVRDLRRSLCQSESEKFLTEDVLNFKKVLQFDRDTKTFSNRAYLETLRVNFERHLKFLDEPLKVFRHMSDDGEIHQMQSHRVYHIHLCVLGNIKIENANFKLQKVYRLVLDKSGLQRVEQIFL
jgi:hypothetical protein